MSLTAEQLATRRTMVTATDQVALAGESPYKNALSVYMDKIGEAEDDPALSRSAPIRIGNHMEALALAILEEEHELKLVPGTTARHPILHHIGATPDARVIANDTQVAVAEAKFVGYRQMHKWGATPPDAVLIQVTQQMLVDRVKLAHVVALIGTEPRFYVIGFDDELAGALLEQGDSFWNGNVLARKPPSPDASERSATLLRQLYPRVRGDVFKASPEVDEIARAYFAAEVEETLVSAKKNAAKNSLMEKIGEHAGIDGDGYRVRWEERKGSVDFKAAFAATSSAIDTEQFRRDSTRAFTCKPTK